MKKTVFQIIACALLIGCASDIEHSVDASFQAVTCPDNRHVTRVMAVGDSITIGYPDGGFRTAIAAARSDFTFLGRQQLVGFHEGQNGKTIDQIRQLVLPAIDGIKPDVVLLLAGTNDMTALTPPDVAVADLATLASEFRQHVDRVFVGTIPPRGSAANTPTIVFNAMIPTAIAADIDFVDVSQDLVWPTDFIDSLHPNETGKAKMGARWVEGLTVIKP